MRKAEDTGDHRRPLARLARWLPCSTSSHRKQHQDSHPRGSDLRLKLKTVRNDPKSEPGGSAKSFSASSAVAIPVKDEIV